MQLGPKQFARRLSLLYGALAVVWCIVSDQILVRFFSETHSFIFGDLVKDSSFVVITALLLYFVLSKEMRKREREVEARKRSQDALRHSEAQLRSVVDNIPQRIFIKDVNSNYLFINQNYARDLGIPADAMVGRSDVEFFPRELADKYVADDQSVMEGKQTVGLEEEENFQNGIQRGIHTVKTQGTEDEEAQILETIKRGESVEQFETRRKSKDGRMLEVSVSASPIRDATGKIVGASKTVCDNTKRKQAEQARLESEAQFRATFEQAAVGMAQIALDGRWLRLNQRFCELTGYSHAELLSKTFTDITHPDDVEGDLHCVKRLLAGEIPTYTREKRYVRKNGASVWAEVTVALVRDVSNVPAYCVSVVEDVTRRLEAETALRNSEKFKQAVLDSVASHIAVLDATGRILAVNLPWLEFSRQNPRPDGSLACNIGVGTNYLHVTRMTRNGETEFACAAAKGIESVVKGKLNRFCLQYPCHSPSEQRWFVMVVTPMGTDGQAVVSHSDISAIKKAEEALARRGKILTAVNHAAAKFLRTADWRQSINEVIAELGKATAVNRVVMFETEPGEQAEILMSQTYEWSSEDMPTREGDPTLAKIPVNAGGFSRWREMFQRGEPLHGLVRDFPACEQPALVSHGIKSIVVVPVTAKGQWWGFLAFDQCDHERNWEQSELEVLQTAASILGETIEKQQAEESLRSTEQQFRAMFELASIGMAQANPFTGQLLRVNQRLCDITGYTEEELLRMTITDITHPGDREWNSRELKRLRNGEISEFRMEKRYLRKDGSVSWANANVTIVHDLPGGGSRATATIEDISERKKSEEALKASEARLNFALETSHTGAWEISLADHQATRTLIHDRIFGYETLQPNWTYDIFLDHVVPEDRATVNRVFQQAKVTKGDWNLEFRIHRVDGAMRWVWAAGGFEHHGENQTDRMSGIIQDITEHRLLAEQFRQAQKMEAIGILAGGVAHDFNNILAIIQMQIEVLRQNRSLPEEASEVADEIGLTVQRAIGLIRQLLLFSRREVFQPADLDLSKSISSTTKMLNRILGETIQVQLALDPTPMMVHADAGMIDQVLMNLAVNARDALPNGGQLIIRTRGVEFTSDDAAKSAQIRPGSFVCLCVSDNGCGIPPEILPRIFDPFFTTKGIGKGTGLGLATVFGIMRQHQGWVTVDSVENKGTTFHTYFPRLNQLNPVPPPAPKKLISRGGDETILLVEDDPSLRGSLKKMLANAGYQVREAVNGTEALQVWTEQKDRLQLLLTDLVMPGRVSGRDLALRILEAKPGFPMILMSGYSPEILSDGIPDNDRIKFLSKLFATSKLMEVLRELLDHSQG